MTQPISLPYEIKEGKDREAQVLLTDRWRKLVLIQLRRGTILADHSARFPITIQTLVGKGWLRLGGEEHELAPGVLIPVDAHAVHNVRPDPDIAILVTFFRHDDLGNDKDTTARFD
jgi:quercetin dioxygenase-like cupin family protein